MKNRYLIFTFFLFLTPSLFGQNLTAYEKKCYSLTTELLLDLGVSKSEITRCKSFKALSNVMLEAILLNKANHVNVNSLIYSYELKIKAADKLKTALELQKDIEIKEAAEMKKRIEIDKQKQRQQQEDIETKEKEKEKEKIEIYNNSDYALIKNLIKEDFNQWLQKGEFEKTEDYQNRISNNSSKPFDSICYKKLTNAFKTKSNFSSHLLKYNADTEKFGIAFTFNDVVFNDSFNIPIIDASKFKNNVDNFRIYVETKDWGFIDNNFTPRKITYFNDNTKESFEFYFVSKDLRSITFSPSELGINLSTTTNNQFSYDDFYYNRMFETKDGSALNSMAWDCLLNQNFQKALRILEKGVQLVNINDDVYPYLLTNLAHAYLFDNKFDKAHKIYFENLNLKLGDKSWKDAILQDFMDFKKGGINSTDMEKIKQELLTP
jgi:hypothetical protein